MFQGILCLIIGIILFYLKIKKKLFYKDLYVNNTPTNYSYNFKGWIGILGFIIIGIFLIFKNLGSK